MESQCCLDLHFSMAEDVEHFFMYLFAICTSENCVLVHLLIYWLE
jgi:hypothetical protein